MYYYTYEIYVNDPDSSFSGCYYYGKHEATEVPNKYFGSGKLIQRYIKKHGTDKLIKTILHFYPNREELLVAEKVLVDEKKNQLGSRCLNLHEGGSGGHWVEYCSEEEYACRVSRTREGMLRKTTPEWRKMNAQRAGNSKKYASEATKARWRENYVRRHQCMSAEEKQSMYTKVSESLHQFYNNESNAIIIQQMKARNKQSNIESAKKWRGEFQELFGCTPESFRRAGKMKEAIDLYKRVTNVCEEQKQNEINRFMESIKR